MNTFTIQFCPLRGDTDGLGWKRSNSYSYWPILAKWIWDKKGVSCSVICDNAERRKSSTEDFKRAFIDLIRTEVEDYNRTWETLKLNLDLDVLIKKSIEV